MSDYRIEENLLILETKDVTDVVVLNRDCITWYFLTEEDHVTHLFFGSCFAGVYEPKKGRFFLFYPDGTKWKWIVFEEVKPVSKKERDDFDFFTYLLSLSVVLLWHISEKEIPNLFRRWER